MYDDPVVVWSYDSKFRFRNIFGGFVQSCTHRENNSTPDLFRWLVCYFGLLHTNDKTYIHTVLSYFVMWFYYPFVIMAYLNEVVRFVALTWLSTQTKLHNTIVGIWRKLEHMNKMNDYENCDLQNRFDIKFAVYRIMLLFNALDICIKVNLLSIKEVMVYTLTSEYRWIALESSNHSDIKSIGNWFNALWAFEYRQLSHPARHKYNK